jgi:hypothetical protein
VARSGEACVEREQAGTFTPARDAGVTEEAARSAFEKLGDTRLSLGSLAIDNPAGLFVPVSKLNSLRRDVAAALEAALDEARSRRVADVLLAIQPQHQPTAAVAEPLWSLKTDRLAHLDAFTDDDWHGLDELVLDIARDHPALLAERLDTLGRRLGREKVRLALPPLTRKWEERGIVHKVERLRAAGWAKWEASNLSAWSFLAPLDGLDLATDWPVYVLNRAAARQVVEMGATRFALSPEDGLANMRSLLREHGERAVIIVHQDTPQFLAESCAYANLIGGCPGKANCSFESMEMVSSHGERVTALDYHCRTIVLNQGPFCLSPHLDELREAGASRLRVDFVYRKYAAEEAARRWRDVRAGRPVPGGHAANFHRGVL